MCSSSKTEKIWEPNLKTWAYISFLAPSWHPCLLSTVLALSCRSPGIERAAQGVLLWSVGAGISSGRRICMLVASEAPAGPMGGFAVQQGASSNSPGDTSPPTWLLSVYFIKQHTQHENRSSKGPTWMHLAHVYALTHAHKWKVLWHI